MVEVGHAKCYDSGNNGGMLLVFGDVLVVKVAFGMPYFAIVEVVSFEVACAEFVSRHTVPCDLNT